MSDKEPQHVSCCKTLDVDLGTSLPTAINYEIVIAEAQDKPYTSLTNVISRVSRDDVNDADANPQKSSVNPEQNHVLKSQMLVWIQQ